ncbi:24231_t:CDS:2, partial [Cetraspora pellucida]
FHSENDKNNTDSLYSENCQNDADKFLFENCQNGMDEFLSETIKTMDEVEMKLNQYARATGFTLCRKHLELDGDGIIRCRTFECSFSSTPTSNQIIDLTQQHQVTSIVRDHNHDMISDVHLYAFKYHKLSEEIKERIRFYVTKGNMESKQIYPLLVASFPDQYIHKRDLYNKVQKIKAPLTKRHGDAQNIINKLLALKDQETEWIIYTRIDLFDNHLSTQRVEVINQLIKDETSSMSSLCNLHDQVQNLLDGEATWAWYNIYLQSLPTNQAPSIIEPLFPEVIKLMTKYLTPHILLVQWQQITGSLLYWARNISKEIINNIKTSLQFLLEEIESSDIIEDSNDKPLTADLHIFNKLRVPDTFTYKVRQRVQRKAKYIYGFEKMKKALNLALDLDCEEEFINMVNRFIDCKKNYINETNKINNSHISDPVIQKQCGHSPTKRIKLVSETSIHCINSKSSAINPVDPNLYVQQHTPQVASLRTPFRALNSDNSERNICVSSDNINVNI